MDIELRRLREDAGLSVRELAARAGTSHSTIVAYEQGRKIPRVDTRNRLIRAAGREPGTAGPRRVRVNERGGSRGQELTDVIILATSFPNARGPASLTTAPFPPRLGVDG